MLLIVGGLCAVTCLVAAPNPAAAAKGTASSGFTLPERRGSLDAEAGDYLGNKKTEAAVKRGLKFLATNQNADGSWGDSRTNSADVAISGLCALSFMSAGHQPGRGPYGKVLNKTVDYLADHAQPTGLIIDPHATIMPMYGHGFATLALAEMYGMTRRPDLREKLENAVALILRTQNSEGGWRYQPRIADADISVVICQIMALRAAANAGVRVPRDTTARAIEYVKRCANNADGGFSYRPSQPGSGQARTGAGALALIVMGQRDSPECKGGLEYLLRHPPGGRDQWVFYSLYYSTQACYQAGGKYWRFWYPKAADFLVGTQSADGSWYDSYGAPYATAMGVLALQVPASLLPIYQK